MINSNNISCGQVETVLKGVVRSERLENPADFIAAILSRVKKEHLQVCHSYYHSIYSLFCAIIDFCRHHLLLLLLLQSAPLRGEGVDRFDGFHGTTGRSDGPSVERWRARCQQHRQDYDQRLAAGM